jgi:hypothetical protein
MLKYDPHKDDIFVDKSKAVEPVFHRFAETPIDTRYQTIDWDLVRVESPDNLADKISELADERGHLLYYVGASLPETFRAQGSIEGWTLHEIPVGDDEWAYCLQQPRPKRKQSNWRPFRGLWS